MAALVLALCALGWVAAVAFFWRARAWLPYYALGASGAALLIVVASREVFPFELWLRIATVQCVGAIAAILHVGAIPAPEAGTLLVSGFGRNEWTHFSVGLESSGLLEAATLGSLVALYPRGGFRERALMVAGAVIASFLANVLRVLVIVSLVGLGGQDLLEFAHLFLGRVLFFLMAMVLFWLAITRPMLATVGARIQGGH